MFKIIENFVDVFYPLSSPVKTNIQEDTLEKLNKEGFGIFEYKAPFPPAYIVYVPKKSYIQICEDMINKN